MRARILTGLAGLTLVLSIGATFAACATGSGETTASDLDATANPGAPRQGDGAGGQDDASSSAAPPESDDAPSDDVTTIDGGNANVAGDAYDDAPDVFDAGPTCVETDAGCATGNPGGCGPGTILCDGGAAVCAPIATTQACYTGTASTRNVGVCKDGTQSCIGTLGTCNGEVLPAAEEDCFNTLDDDCDGVVNNGCPISLSLGGDRPLSGAGGGGGGPGTLHCPTGAFVTRVDSWFDNGDEKASGVSIYCATPSLVQGASMYSVTLTPNTPAPYGTLTGVTSPVNERTDDCGITGLTAISYTVGLADTYVEGLGAHCGTSAVTLAANNTITFDFTNDGNESYNDWAGSTGSFFDQACNTNEVVVGYDLRTGDWMDNIQAICAPLGVSYR